MHHQRATVRRWAEGMHQHVTLKRLQVIDADHLRVTPSEFVARFVQLQPAQKQQRRSLLHIWS